MPPPKLVTAALLSLLFLGGAPAVAHPPAAPSTQTPAADVADAEIDQVLSLLRGAFISAPGSAEPLAWHSAPVHIAGLDNALYFEIAPADRLASPVRQGVLHVFRRRGELRLRVFDFAGEPTFPGAVVGLWAAPDLFPPVSAAMLDPNLDLVLTPTPDGYRGRTEHPAPTVKAGAVEMTSELDLAPGVIQSADRGFDASGRQVWGPAPGESVVFRSAPQRAVVTRRPSGLVTIDLVLPDSENPALVEGGTITVHYSGWRTDGVRFETSREEGRQPLMTRVPGTGLKGVDEALLGMAAGMHRRAIIPPELGFGEKGSLRGRIPPGATLLYEFEAIDVRNPVPGQPPPRLPSPPPDDE